MQDYSSLGITSIPDRKKLFQLVQSLRQEIPTLENGLVSSPNSKYRFAKSPPSSSSASSNNNVPDLANLNITAARRGSGQPTHQPPLQQQIPTRSRSRTLPSSDHYRPEFLKSNSSNNFFNEEATTSLTDSDDSDDSDKCEIRRGSGPLLDPYGVPIQNKLRYNAIRNQSQSMTPGSMDSSHTLSTVASAASNNSNMTPIASPMTSAASPLQQSQQLMGQSDLNQKIRVCVRKRPLNKKELERAEKDIAPTAGVRSINVNEPK